jgi:hypothetical protein
MQRSIFPLAIAAGFSVLAGCAAGPLAAPYNVVAYKPHNPDNVRVKVSLAKQNVYVLEGDRVLLAAATNVGIPEKPTPRGNFRIYNKIEQKRSGSYGFYVQGNNIVPGETSRPQSGRYVGYPMGYWCEFAPAYGFHAGYVHPVPRTHGCLRLHKTVAPKFYELVKIGTPVNIATTQPEDETIGRSVQRPTDYRDPDPPASYMISTRAFERPAGPLLIEQ